MSKKPHDLKGQKEETLQGDYITDKPIAKTTVITDSPPQPIAVMGNQEPINQFIEWPITRPDGAYQPIQYRAAGHLLSAGIDPENIQAASLVLTTMLSARWGYPIAAMLVSEDPQEAVRVLDHCIKMSPMDSTIEFREVKPDHLYIKGGGLLKGKCVICPEVGGFSKVARDFDLILTRGHSVRQQLEKGKYEVGLSEYRSEMKVSFIGIDGGKLKNGFCHPSIIKIPISSRRSDIAAAFSDITEQYGLMQSPTFKIRKSFQRLKSRVVIIPYEEQLWRALNECGCDHLQEKMGVLKNVISVCAIINRPPVVQMAELGAYIYGTNEQEVSRWLIDAGIENPSVMSPEEDIVATKVDYYLARLLLDGIILTGYTRFTDRQKKVFETVKAINLGKMSTVILSKGDEVEILANISKSQSGWAPREKVFETINNGSYDFSLSSVNSDLVELFEMGLLERAKPHKSRFYGYFINTMTLSDAIKLPDPATIMDPVYEGKTITIVNPLTGQVEKI